MPSGRHSAKFDFFFKFLCRVPSVWHSAKFEFFFKKKSLPSAMVLALGKAEKMVFRAPIFPALPSAVTIALGNGVLCRVQHSAKWPKTVIFYFCLHSIMTNKFIQTYITYISHPSHIYVIRHIYISSIHTSIRTYHIHHNIYHIYNNKCSSSSK